MTASWEDREASERWFSQQFLPLRILSLVFQLKKVFEWTATRSIFRLRSYKHIFECQDEIYCNNKKSTSSIYNYRDDQRSF